MLTNAIDLHIHTAPDVIARSVTDIQAAQQAKKAGMRGILLKNHQTPTYGRAAVAQEAVPGVNVFGGLVLNAYVGGINPSAVKAACTMGAKCIWMPTGSAVQHMKHFKAGGIAVPVFGPEGKPVDGLLDVLDMVAAADCILATGHLAPEESCRLVDLALERKVRKIVITHPEFEAVAMPVALQKDCARKGAFIERCFYATHSAQKLPVASVAEEIKAVGWESTVLASDFGQDYNVPPVEGLKLFLEELARCGIAEKHLQAMVSSHPASLLGL